MFEDPADDPFDPDADLREGLAVAMECNRQLIAQNARLLEQLELFLPRVVELESAVLSLQAKFN